MMSPACTRIGPVALGPNAPTLDRFLTPILQKRSALFADEKGILTRFQSSTYLLTGY